MPENQFTLCRMKKKVLIFILNFTISHLFLCFQHWLPLFKNINTYVNYNLIGTRFF